jgi:hypothetical protein
MILTGGNAANQTDLHSKRQWKFPPIRLRYPPAYPGRVIVMGVLAFWWPCPDLVGGWRVSASRRGRFI